MIKTKKGISLVSNGDDRDLLVIDSELIITTIKKFFGLVKRYTISENDTIFFHALKKLIGQFEEVNIAIVGDSKKRENALKKFKIDVSCVTFFSEEEYRNWLRMVNPKLHLATIGRIKYSKNSKLAKMEINK